MFKPYIYRDGCVLLKAINADMQFWTFDFRTEWEPLYCIDLRRHVNCVVEQSGENEYNLYYI